jgi:hypothetical protein
MNNYISEYLNILKFYILHNNKTSVENHLFIGLIVWNLKMEASSILLIAGLFVIVLVAGMTLYPLLQAFGIIECNCDKFDREERRIANGQAS